MDLTTTDHAVTTAETTIAGFPATTCTPVAPRSTTTAVFVHGAFADHTGFAPWQRHFAARGVSTVAASRRGRHGIEPRHAAGLGFHDYVDDTRRVVDEVGPDVVLIGHSLGGLIAQRLAAEGRCRALVLLASAPPAMLTAQPIALPRFLPSMGKILTGRPFVVGGDACSVLALNRMPETERPALHSQLTEESGKVYRSLLLGTIRVDPSKVRVPVFVAGGTDDHIISTRLLRKTARHYGVEPHLYAGHAHWLLAEPGWQDIANDVLAWLPLSR